MAVGYPRRGTVRNEPRDMVRVQLRDNDVRSYERSEVEGLKAQYPGAFIMGEQESEGDAPVETKAQRSAPNKARQPKKADAAPAGAPVETKAEPPAPPVETKSE